MQKLRLRYRWIPALVGIVLVGTAHADPVWPSPTADKPLENLLRKVEQQVAIGHAMAPFDDNAMETWQSVLVMVQRGRVLPGVDAVRVALGDFAARLRTRAATERTAQPILASDFTVFADQATRLLADVPSKETAEPSEAKPVPLTKEAPAPLPKPVDKAPEPITPVPVALTPPALTPAPPPARIVEPVQVTIAPPQSAPVTPMTKPTETAQSAFFAKRGDEMLQVKDISAARKFYEAAAQAGNARAAVILAKSYDPFFVKDFETMVFRPDPDMAVFWYRQAVALGDPEAAARLNSLIKK